MCAHYESCKNPEKLKQHFGIDTVPEAAKSDLWPGYLGLFIRRNQPEDASSGDAVSEREALAGSFGLIPHWANDTKIARNTYNARAETVAEKPSFRDREGCNYVSRLGLVPKHETSGCSIIARYSSGFLGSDRVILLDDDRFVTLSSAAVLGNADTDVKLPDTPDQRRASFITDAVFAALIMMLIFVFYDIFKPGKSEKKGSESCPRK